MHLRPHLFFTFIVFCLLKATISETATTNGTKIKTVYTKRSAAGNVKTSKICYYWKRFDGKIPEDAFIGATHFGNNVYIGRGPVTTGSSRGGLFIGAIAPGANTIMINPYNDAYTLDSFLEILSCNKPCNLTWIKTDDDDVQKLMDNTKVIEGGYDYETFDSLYVGRDKFDGEYVIGHVDARYDFQLYYVQGSSHSYVHSYDVLCYFPDPGV